MVKLCLKIVLLFLTVIIGTSCTAIELRSSPAQQWLLKVIGSDPEGLVVQIQSGNNKNCIGNSVEDGNFIKQFDCLNVDAQKWVVVYKDRYFLLKNIKNRKCIGVSSSSTADGTPLVQNDCLGIDDQLWVYKHGRLINKNSGKCINLNVYALRHLILEQMTCK